MIQRIRCWPLLLAACALLICPTAVKSNEALSKFDYFVLAMEWPFSFCREEECVKADQLPPYFNIHGLWPSWFHGSWPSNCDGEEFNLNELAPLRERLAKWWMNYKSADRADEEFWKHEYNKHGKCAAGDERFNSTVKYFNTTLNARKKTPILRMLADAGIRPGSDPIKGQAVHDAVLKGVGKSPYIVCISKSHENLLLEIRVCFDKSLAPINCPDDSVNASFQRRPSASTWQEILSGLLRRWLRHLRRWQQPLLPAGPRGSLYGHDFACPLDKSLRLPAGMNLG